MPVLIRRRRQRLLCAVVLWVILLGVLALMPENIVLFFLRTPDVYPAAHAVVYGCLSVLVLLYLRFHRVFFSFRMNDKAVFILTFLICTCCGAATEAVQVFSPDRRPDWYDLQWDMAGVVLSMFLFRFFWKGIPALHSATPADQPALTPRVSL